jgi:hypothetical protein
MSNCYNPNDLSLDSIKKSVRRDCDFSIREIRKFRRNSPGLREFLKPAQDPLCSVAKAKGRRGVIPANMSQSGKKLDSCGSCELRFHDYSSASRASASAKTEDRSRPSLHSISFSPLAKRWRSSLSRSERS